MACCWRAHHAGQPSSGMRCSARKAAASRCGMRPEQQIAVGGHGGQKARAFFVQAEPAADGSGPPQRPVCPALLFFFQSHVCLFAFQACTPVQSRRAWWRLLVGAARFVDVARVCMIACGQSVGRCAQTSGHPRGGFYHRAGGWRAEASLHKVIHKQCRMCGPLFGFGTSRLSARVLWQFSVPRPAHRGCVDRSSHTASCCGSDGLRGPSMASPRCCGHVV